VPNDERNLAYKAAHELKKIYQIPYGVRIDIQKKIPVSAGLGGGRSDAAAVLRGLHRVWGLQLFLYRLAEIGSYIGSDVACGMYGATALVRGGVGKGQRL